MLWINLNVHVLIAGFVMIWKGAMKYSVVCRYFLMEREWGWILARICNNNNNGCNGPIEIWSGLHERPKKFPQIIPSHHVQWYYYAYLKSGVLNFWRVAKPLAQKADGTLSDKYLLLSLLSKQLMWIFNSMVKNRFFFQYFQSISHKETNLVIVTKFQNIWKPIN